MLGSAGGFCHGPAYRFGVAGMLFHASSVARGAEAVLLLGPPGSGKSDLALRLIRDGWALVADDQCVLRSEGGTLRAEAPAALRGMLEVRGLGVFTGLPVAGTDAALRLAVRLVPPEGVSRLPSPAVWRGVAGASLPEVALDPGPSAPAKVALALDAAAGRVRQLAGAFA
jgi:serine kinase of HPr protein (carbohydrate metabolism regulator)